MVERPGGKHGQRQPGLDGHPGRGRHRAVAAADRKHLGARGRVAQDFRRVVVGAEFHGSSTFGSASATSSTTRAPVPLPDSGLMTSTTPEPSGRSGASTRSGSVVGQGCFDDRRHEPTAQDRQARPDAEPGDDIARVVRAGRHPRQSDQPGEQRQPEAQHRILQTDPDGERGGAGGVPRRQ